MGEIHFKETQGVTSGEQATYEGVVIENAVKLHSMGEDAEKYLADKGVIVVDPIGDFLNFEPVEEEAEPQIQPQPQSNMDMLFGDAWNEKDHKRDRKGRFGHGRGGAKKAASEKKEEKHEAPEEDNTKEDKEEDVAEETTAAEEKTSKEQATVEETNSEGSEKEGSEDAIEITGNELGEYSSFKELRSKAVKYYKDNLQGKVIDNPELKGILFSRVGIDKFVSSYATENKFKMVVALEDIVKTGKYEGSQELTKPRTDGIVKFHRISKTVRMEGKSYNTSLLIGEDKNGRRFYNLNDNVEESFKDEAPKGTSPNMVKPIGAERRIAFTDNIIQNGDNINIYLEAL